MQLLRIVLAIKSENYDNFIFLMDFYLILEFIAFTNTL